GPPSAEISDQPHAVRRFPARIPRSGDGAVLPAHRVSRTTTRDFRLKAKATKSRPVASASRRKKQRTSNVTLPLQKYGFRRSLRNSQFSTRHRAGSAAVNEGGRTVGRRSPGRCGRGEEAPR